MSKQVDERVVSMQFDNKNFERNVQTTLGTLDKLKQSLNLTGATKGLENVGSAAKKVDLSGLSTAAETVRAKFSALEVMGVTALANITNSAVNAGKRIVSALTIDPIKTGFQEYETQINAVQTILANTESKGTTLNDVNGALDTLNEYADKTIYNFTEMTRNIGTFTAAGVDLDTSVNAIQGIANLAAVSGSNSQQASTAMYQLSQALASGTVKLMDWNSVVNAGMGGQVFQDALKETARVHGVAIDDLIKKNGSFRETLQEGWLTSEILTETLSKFTMATEGLTEAEIAANREKLKGMGYTDEQIEGIFKLGNTATNAATKVKTFTQLWDTLKETAQSGWTQTWEIIAGDFEEAKSLFSELYETISPILEASAKTRNELLQGWSDLGGRTKVLESMRNIFDGIANVAKPIKEAFREIFPPTTSEQLFKFTESFKNLTDKFVSFTEKYGPQIKSTFKGIFAVLDIGLEAVKAIGGVFLDLVGYIAPASGGFLDITASVGDFLVKIRDTVKAGDIFNKVIEKIGNFIKPVVDGVKNMGKTISDTFDTISSKAKVRFEPLTALGNALKAIFVGIGKVVAKAMPLVVGLAKGIGSIFTSLMDKISSSIQGADYNKLFDILNGGIFATIGVFIAKFIKSGGDLLDNAGGILDNIKEIIGGVGDALGAFTQQLKAKTLKEIATAIAILAASLFVISLIDSEKLAASLGAVAVMFAELMGSLSIFSKMADGKEFNKTNQAAKIMKKLATSLLILAVAMKIMGSMSWDEMKVGLTGITVGLGALVVAVNFLPEKKVTNAAKAIRKLSTSMIVLAVAFKIMGSMSWDEMKVGLTGMAVGLGALVVAVRSLPKDTSKRAAGMIGLATAVVVLGAAFKIMGSMSWDEMKVGLTGMAVGLGALVVAVRSLPKDAAIRTLGMVGLATSVVILASALKIMGSMSIDEMSVALKTLCGSLAAIAVAMKFMKSALSGAGAMLIVAGALAILAPILKIFSSMSLEEIAKSLGMLAGVFAVIGLAGKFLAPVVPAIAGLAGSIALLGVGVLAAGVGVLAFAAGLTALGAALAVSGAGIVTFVASIIGLIPFLLEQIGVGIIKICEVIAGSVDAICAAVTTIVLAVVDALVTCIPAIAEGAFKLIVGLLEVLIEYLPQIVPLLVDLFVKLIDLVVEQLPRITEATFRFLAALIDSIASEISILIEPLVKLFGMIFQGIADVIGPIIQEVIAPILSVLVDLLVGLFEVVAPYLPQICAHFENLATIIADAMVRITEAIAPYIPEITAAIQSICDAIIAVAEQIAPVLHEIAGIVEEVGEAIENIFNGIADVIRSVGDTIKSVLDGISGVFDSIGDAALNAGTGFEKMAKGIKIITDLKLADMAASLAAVATGLGKIAKHSDGISKTGTGMKKIADSVKISQTAFANAAIGITTLIDNLSSIGPITTTAIATFNAAMTSLTAGLSAASMAIKTQTLIITTSIVSMGAASVSAINSFRSQMALAGGYLMDGLASGIRGRSSSVISAARSVAKSVESIIRAAWQVNSPSKLFYKIALGVGEGISGAFKDSITGIKHSTVDLSDAATNGFRDAILQITEFIDSDMNTQPTIRPVLDLSEVAAGAGSISGLFGMTPSVGVLSSVGAINSMMTNRIQNGSNSDVVSALKDLKNSLNNKSGDSYSVGAITYDDGSNIADAIKTLTRAVKMEGRT